MNRKIEDILKDIKDNYDEIGGAYYPDDLFYPMDAKVIYDYIIEKDKEIERLNNIINKIENDKKQVKGLKEKFKVGVDSAICIEVLKNIIKDVYSSIHHELHGHILQHDEDSWNPEYYTNGKLDYRKLLVALLSDYKNRLSKGVDKNEN